jgi:hypothetical protein
MNTDITVSIAKAKMIPAPKTTARILIGIAAINNPWLAGTRACGVGRRLKN